MSVISGLCGHSHITEDTETEKETVIVIVCLHCYLLYYFYSHIDCKLLYYRVCVCMICVPGLVPKVCIVCVARACPGTYKAQEGQKKQQQKTGQPGGCYNY